MKHATQHTVSFTFVEMADALVEIAAKKDGVIIPNYYVFKINRATKEIEFDWNQTKETE